jgi:carbon-monoxide dehydrogenase medium subunit
MKLPDFEFLEPQSVGDAVALLAEDPTGSVVYAGGTDILVYLKEGAQSHRRLVSLHRVEGLKRVEFDTTTGLRINAMATVNAVLRHEAVVELYPGIADAAASLAADQVRNAATVVGNLCMAVPSADMAPTLLAHDAQLRVSSPDGERLIPLREFFVGPRETVLTDTDVVTAVEVAAPSAGSGSASRRQGGRASLSLPIASAAAHVVIDGSVIRAASIALGAVAPTPLLATEAGGSLVGVAPTAEHLARAGELAADAAKPIDDLRGSKEFRLELVRVLVRRVVRTSVDRASSGTGKEVS